jgi:hypothetical protein
MAYKGENRDAYRVSVLMGTRPVKRNRREGADIKVDCT